MSSRRQSARSPPPRRSGRVAGPAQGHYPGGGGGGASAGGGTSSGSCGGGTTSTGACAGSSGLPMPEILSLIRRRNPPLCCGTGVTGAGTRPGAGSVTPGGSGTPLGASGPCGRDPSAGASGSGAGASGASGSATGTGSTSYTGGGGSSAGGGGSGGSAASQWSAGRQEPAWPPSVRPAHRMCLPQLASRRISRSRPRSVACRSPAIPTPRRSPRRHPTWHRRRRRAGTAKAVEVWSGRGPSLLRIRREESGPCVDAMAAPRARANWASAGTNTGTASTSSRCGVIASRSLPDPTSTRASGCHSAWAKIALNQRARSSSVVTAWLTAVCTAPSLVSTTSTTTASGSMTQTAVIS